jgi:putative peptide maturation dehydrogenase
MKDITVRLRRRRYLLLRVADEPVLDIARFLRGEIEVGSAPECTLLCPVRGQSLPLTAADVALIMTLPADRWLMPAELLSKQEEVQARLLDLAKRGVLLSDPAPEGWDDLVPGEQGLEKMQWLDLAAVYHAHTRWQGVAGSNVSQARDEEDHRVRLERLREIRGDPPAHFVRRPDAEERTALRVPVLTGVFFDALLARRTTRAYRSEQSLPLSALELMLYAVFGTHGVKYFAPGIVGIKRTSPSGGALHPIEAYVLLINVDELPAGLYHYETGAHALARLERMDNTSARDLACAFTAGQGYFAEAHALVIHVARFDRNFWKYGQHRKAYKTVLMDSAHLSQTFYLTAAHLGLGAFYTAAINDADIGDRLKLRPTREAAIGINGVGVADSGRDELHFVPDPYRPTGVA